MIRRYRFVEWFSDVEVWVCGVVHLHRGMDLGNFEL